jgi:hypothetical protein
MRLGWLFGAAIGVAAALCLAFRYLPPVDLPQHYAMVSVFTHYRDPAYGFAERYFFDLLARPYATVYLLAAGMARLMPLGAAMRIVVALCTVAPAVGLWALLAAIGRPRHHALAAVPFSFGAIWFWGFLNFLLGTGLFLAALALTVRVARDGKTLDRVALGALALVTLFTHVHGLFMLLALAPPMVWAFAPDGTRWRGWLRALVPLAPATLAMAFFVLTTWHDAVGTWPRIDPGAVERVGRFPDFLAAGLPAPWPLLSTLALLALAGLALMLRDPDTRLPRRQRLALAAALAGQLLLYFALPLNTSTATFVSARHALLCALFVLPLLPPSTKSARVPVAAAMALFAFAGLALTARTLARFDREARDFDPILAAIRPNQRIAPLVFDRGSPALHPSTFPYLHFAAYAQAQHGGDLARSFAVVWNVPVRYRDGQPPHRVREEVEWQPQRFSLDEDLPYFDYLLIRSRHPIPLPPNRGLSVAAQSGPWTLVENPNAVKP